MTVGIIEKKAISENTIYTESCWSKWKPCGSSNFEKNKTSINT